MSRSSLIALCFLASGGDARRIAAEDEVGIQVDRDGYAGIDTPPRYDCGREFTLGNSEVLPDLLANAHSWCNSDLVPEEKRVPEPMRGLYWMKELGLSDVAFCGSLGEWDAETRTARIPVWSAFVVSREPDETVPQLIREVAGHGSGVMGFGLGSGILIYSIVFTNSSLKEAVIYPSAPIFNAIASHPMIEMDATPDGLCTSERPGDIFDRPSFFLGGLHQERYFAVKVMYDDGSIHPERAAMMRANENPNNVTYMRYAPTC